MTDKSDSSNKTPLYGFSFMKDGVRFDYPFKEMLTCMSNFVDKCYVALGENDDGTSEVVETFEKVEIIPTVWDMTKIGDGGQIFSEQTNIALSKLRENHRTEKGAWAIYLQSDEIIHENDFEQVRKDIAAAEASGCDAVRFRYFHFWMDHYHIAINKRWYPHEIRAIKVASDVVNYGDAQGFSEFTKVYESDVHIFHYGHVRDMAKREEKQKDLINRIRPGKKFSKYLSREKKAFSKTKVLPLFIKHSKVMQSRIENMGEKYTMKDERVLFVVGEEDSVSLNFYKLSIFSNIKFVQSVSEVPFEYRNTRMIIMKPTLYEKVQWPYFKYHKMLSENAREWDNKTLLLLSLSSLSNKHSC
jgi:hypothetical protein